MTLYHNLMFYLPNKYAVLQATPQSMVEQTVTKKRPTTGDINLGKEHIIHVHIIIQWIVNFWGQIITIFYSNIYNMLF